MRSDAAGKTRRSAHTANEAIRPGFADENYINGSKTMMSKNSQELSEMPTNAEGHRVLQEPDTNRHAIG